MLGFLVLKQMSSRTAQHLNSTKYNHNITSRVLLLFFSCTRKLPHKMYHKNKSWVLVGVFWGSLVGDSVLVFLEARAGEKFVFLTKGYQGHHFQKYLLTHFLQCHGTSGHRARTLTDKKNPTKSRRNLGKIPCVHTAGRYWRAASSRKPNTSQTPVWEMQRSIPTETHTFPIIWLPGSRWQSPTFPWLTA